MKYTLLIALMLGLLLPALAGAQEPTEETAPAIDLPIATFNGVWIRNPALSDDPSKMMSQRGGSPGGVGGGMGGAMGGSGRGAGNLARSGMGGGSRGGTRGAGRIPDGINDTPPGKQRPNMMRGRERLDIFHEDEEFSVTNAMDIMQTVYTDGRRTERWTELGQMFDTATPTKNGIRIRSEMPDGNSRTATYTLSDTGDRLTVIHSFKPPKSKQAVTLKMVYDRAE